MAHLLTRPWGEIRRHYAGLTAASEQNAALLAPMLRLVEAVEASRYAGGLHAWTSMDDLCITQLPARHPHGWPFLRITPLAGGRLEFRYIDTWRSAEQWHRVAEGADGFARLEAFLVQLHWFEQIPTARR